jgi:DNA-binding IclR family transcriptional regulator
MPSPLHKVRRPYRAFLHQLFIVAEPPAKSSIQVIDRMFALLDALERHDGPVNLKQLAAETSLHASTAHRILSVLAQNRMVERVGAGSYRLGLRLRELGRRVQDSQTAIPPAQP